MSNQKRKKETNTLFLITVLNLESLQLPALVIIRLSIMHEHGRPNCYITFFVTVYP